MPTPVYDDTNIFAKILRGEMPCHKVFENEAVLAIMDIMPRANGHVLVLPKAPTRNLLDAHPEDLSKLIIHVQKIARAVKSAFDADGVTILQYNERAGGQIIFHLHFHIIPRWSGDELRPPATARESPEVLDEFAKRIAAAIEAE
jgi:histidine triad (HIT) family protein